MYIVAIRRSLLQALDCLVSPAALHYVQELTLNKLAPLVSKPYQGVSERV